MCIQCRGLLGLIRIEIRLGLNIKYILVPIPYIIECIKTDQQMH
jgi:hypothetical protein